MTEQLQTLEARRRHDTAIILHLYYPEMWECMRSCLSHLGREFDLFVTAPHEVDLPESNIRASFPDAQIYRCENRGRDIAPFLAVFRAISALGFDYICKIHTKKSPQLVDGQAWQRDMLDKLLGSPGTIALIKQAFDKHPDWGLIAPAGHVLPLMADSYYWGSNAALVIELARSAGIRVDDVADLEFSFVAGSMFWFRPQAFTLLSDSRFDTKAFPPEEGKLDGTLAHAMERFFGLVVDRSGFKIAESNSREVRLSEVPLQLRLLLGQTQDLNQRVQALSRLLAEKEAAAQWALAELEQRRRDIDELTKRMKEGAARESTLEDSVAKARDEAGRQSQELSDAHEREQKVQAELDRAQERARRDHTQIEDLTRQLATLTEQRTAVSDQLAAVTDQLAAVTDQLTAATGQLLTSRADLDAAKARSAADDARIQNLTGKVAAATDRVHHVMGELSEARSRIAADEARIHELNAELAEVRQHLQSVLASASWRWTAPLRKIRDLM